LTIESTMLLTIISKYPSVAESIPFILLGFMVVVTVLALLWFLTGAIGYIFKHFGISDPIEHTASANGGVATQAAIKPETVAVVAAAVHAALDRGYRIVSIKQAADNPGR